MFSKQKLESNFFWSRVIDYIIFCLWLKNCTLFFYRALNRENKLFYVKTRLMFYFIYIIFLLKLEQMKKKPNCSVSKVKSFACSFACLRL